MQTNTLIAHDFGIGHVSVNGYTKDDKRGAEIQVCLSSYGKSSIATTFYMSPDEARRFAAAIAAAATAAEIPE